MELSVTHNLSMNDNMEELKTHLKSEINHKYNIVVTRDTVAESKKLMANINKDKKSFNDKCKSFLSEIISPVNEFKSKQKDISTMYDNAYFLVQSQVKSFESGRLELAKLCLDNYRDSVCEEKGINPKSINIDSLVLLGSITAKGELSGTAKSKVDQMILAVEAEVLRAKLEAEEKAKRDREIAEKSRIEAEEKAKQQAIEAAKLAEIEKQKAVDNAIKETISSRKHVPYAPDPDFKPATKEIKKPVIADDGKRIFTIISSFEVKAKSNIDIKKIENHFIKITSDIGLEAKNIQVS